MKDEDRPNPPRLFRASETDPMEVLLIEPDARAARCLRESSASMTSGRFRIRVSSTLPDAVAHLERERFAAILFSLNVPETFDAEILRRIETNSPFTPIIILADSDSEALETRAARFEPQDYIVKSKCDGRILSRVIRHSIERKRIEEALRQSEQRFKRLLASTTDYIYTVPVERGQASTAVHGPGCVKVTGYSPADYAVDPMLWYRMIHPDDRTNVTHQIERVLQGEATAPIEHRIFHKDGSIRWVRNTAVPRLDQHGKVSSYDGLISDITERKIEEEKRRRSEQGLQAIMDNSPAVIYLKDQDGRYLMVNRQYESLFHVVRDEIRGKTDYDIFPKGLAETIRANDRKVVESKNPSQFEEVVPHDDGLHTYVSMKFPVLDVAGVSIALCGISTDITERKVAETKLLAANAELRQANDELKRSEHALRKALRELESSHQELKATQMQLIQAGKLECVGTLAAGVAHEVKNPLQTMLMGLAYLGNNNLDGADENIPMVIADMREAVYRADAIVRDLLQFASASRLEMADHDLNTIIKRSLKLVHYELIRANVTVIEDLAEPLPLARLDPAKMEQVFINLYLNAIQAMPKGGTLTVRTRASADNSPKRSPIGSEPVPDRAGEGDLSRPMPTSGVIAEVEDTGSGIPEASLARVFDPFFTTKAPGVGTGLGLPVTKKIVELHGGVIKIHNVPAGGARVIVQLGSSPSDP